MSKPQRARSAKPSAPDTSSAPSAVKKPTAPSSANDAPLQTDGFDHIPLLKILSSADRKRIREHMTETQYGKGDVIFREGEPTQYFHIVTEGSVKCVKSTPDGKECTLKMLMPGDLFCCDAAAFDQGLHPGTAHPIGDVRVLRMSKQAYFDMLRQSPEAAMEVIRYLGHRLNEAQEKAKVLALDRADQRLATLLIDLAARNGVPEAGGIRLGMRLTRQDMANMVGTTTETVIRIMGRFKKSRLVSGTANHLIIRDFARLKAFASDQSSK
ncbi:MAG: Crp/Fnr family transcriptional regulator [Nitrospiraceae bacterium]